MKRSFKLNSGYSIPAVGLGTWQSGPNEVKEAVAAALKIGYRHIDAAAVYGNESEVGEGIKASGVDRKDVFVSFSTIAKIAHQLTLQRSQESSGTRITDPKMLRLRLILL